MDPVASTLLSVFGGVAFTALAGGIGALIQSRREHARWLRERRYDAVVAALVLLEERDTLEQELDGLAARVHDINARDAAGIPVPNRELLSNATEAVKRVERRFHATIERMDGALVPVRLLGPAPVTEATDALLLLGRASDDARAEATQRFSDAARVALGIKM